MLIQSSLPSSIEAAILHVSDHRQQNSLCDWLPATESCQMSPKCDGKTGPFEQQVDISCPLNFDRSSQSSTVSTMSGSTAPTFVYRRRKLRGNSIPIFSVKDPADTRRTDVCLSVVGSDALSVAIKEQHVASQAEDETKAVETSMMPLITSQSEPHLLRSDLVQEQLIYDEPPKSSKQKIVAVDSINDSCSSSKSNMELVSASMKTEVDETAECSSSTAVVLQVMGKDFSEKDLCVSILRSEGLLERFQPTHNRDFGRDMDSNAGPSSSCSRPCKVCGRLETTLQLLICDNCEESFHVSCYNPRIKKIPSDEWFCHSCLKQKHKILKETARKSPNIINERGRGRNASRKGEPSPIELMFRATEPYTTGVRIGKGFQADVPDWSTPTNIDVDSCGEPLRLDPSECSSLHELNSNKPFKLSSIGNWLQCRQVLEGTGDGLDGTICGKWRRAPLFEFQNDDWECFCSVEWDPAHADCAVPQELETDQVLKQVKYIEMMRPQLAAKRRKSNCAKSGAPQQSRVLINSETRIT